MAAETTNYQVILDIRGGAGGSGDGSVAGGSGMAFTAFYFLRPHDTTATFKYKKRSGGTGGDSTTDGGNGGDSVYIEYEGEEGSFALAIVAGGGGGGGTNSGSTSSGGSAYGKTGTTNGNYYRINGQDATGNVAAGKGADYAIPGGTMSLDEATAGSYGGGSANGDGGDTFSAGGGGGGGGLINGNGGASRDESGGGGGGGLTTFINQSEYFIGGDFFDTNTTGLIFNSVTIDQSGTQGLAKDTTVVGVPNASTASFELTINKLRNGRWVEVGKETKSGSALTTSLQTISFQLNRAPTVNPITQSVHWNSSNNIFNFSGNDADSDPLSYSISSSSGGTFSGGPLNLSNGTVTIENTNQFKVVYSNATTLIFFYKAYDGMEDSTPAQVTINKSNNPPTVTAITQSVHWNSTNNIFDFSGNDADIGDSLNYSISTTANGLYGASISDTNNSVTVDGSQFIVGSSNNSTFTFFYRANDGFSNSTPARVTINKSNDQPTVNDVSYNVHWNSSNNIFDFSGNDANIDSLTYVISSGSGGSFSGDPLNLTGGNVTIDSINTNQFSVDSSNYTDFTFYYKAFDGAEYSTVGTIIIRKLNNAPTASNIVRFTHTAAVTISLFGSDSDRNSITFHKNGDPTETYGTWDDSGITNREIKYTPSSNYSLGSDTYYYYVSDLVDSSNYTITVYSGLTNIKDGGQDLTELYKRKHDNTAGYITLTKTNNKSNYQVNGTDLVDYFEREDGTGTSTSNLKVTIGGTTYALDQIFKKR